MEIFQLCCIPDLTNDENGNFNFKKYNNNNSGFSTDD